VISVEEALSRLLAPLEKLPPEQISIAEGVGRVLAADFAARRTQPPFAVSAMDGYAVRAEDVSTVPVELRIVAEVPAGAGFGGHVGPGETARIFTGAPLPAGTDTIIIQEDTKRDSDRVRVLEGAPRGRYVRREGLDFSEGEVLLRAGRRLTARDIGLLAAMNRPWLFVHRRPRIGIMSTGDEIVMPGDPIGPHQIVSSNSLALAAFVTACGGIPVSVGNAPDDPEALRRIAAATQGVVTASEEPGPTARIGVALPKNDRRQDYLRSRLARAADGILEAFPFEVQDSSMMRLLAMADCLVVRPPHAPTATAGAMVPIVPFPGGALPV